jgi:guanosine-diphosphatase
LYAYSYLGYGAEQGREALNSILASKKQLKIEDPCLNKGFNRDGSVSTRKETYEGVAGNVQVQGASTANSCRIELTKIFNKDKSCPKTKGPYSFQCVYQPEFVITSPNFLVFENFYYVSSGIGVKSEPDSGVTKFPLMTTPSEIENAARKVCNSTWSQVQQGYPVDDQSKDNNIKWCFSSSYAASFLIDGLGLPADKRITVQKFVDGSEIEWALGAALKEASDFLKRTNLRQN